MEGRATRPFFEASWQTLTDSINYKLLKNQPG
jgi:hypothetical protein